MPTYSQLWTEGVTIRQVYAQAPSASDITLAGATADIDGDGLVGGADESDEFIEIKNFSDVAVDISGWQIWASSDGAGSDGFVYHSFAAGTTLAPGESIFVITEHDGTPPMGVVEANGDGSQSFASDSNILWNGDNGEVALLNTSDPANLEYVQWTFDTSGSTDDVTTYTGFPTNTDGSTATRVMSPDDPIAGQENGFIHIGENSDGSAMEPDGAKSFYYDPLTGSVLITYDAFEFLGINATLDQAGVDLNGITLEKWAADNQGAGDDLDGDGSINQTDTYASFTNKSTSDVDISGYTLYYTTTPGDTSVDTFHTFAPGTVLAPGETIYVVTQYTGDITTDPRAGYMVAANQGDLTGATPFGETAQPFDDGGSLVLVDNGGNYIRFAHDGGTLTNLDTTLNNVGATNQIGNTVVMESRQSGGNPGDSETHIYDYDTGHVFTAIDEISVPICFTAGTLIRTKTGDKPIETLGKGELVLTADHGFQPIRWIGCTSFARRDLRDNPKLLPVRIRAGSLGMGLPSKDLLVSRQHRVLLRSPVAARIFGQAEVLLAAIKLVDLDGIDLIEPEGESVEYWHMLFDGHEIVFANDAPTESLYTGPEALKAVCPSAREEIVTLFPQLALPGSAQPPARLIPSRGRDARDLVTRLKKNNKWPYSVSSNPQEHAAC